MTFRTGRVTCRREEGGRDRGHLVFVQFGDVIFQSLFFLLKVHHELVPLLLQFPGLLLCLYLLQVDDVALSDSLLLKSLVASFQFLSQQYCFLFGALLSCQVLALSLLQLACTLTTWQ